MKKLTLIFIIAFTCFAASQAQNTIRMKSETYGMFTVSADTMTILKSDKVAGIAVYCPYASTDSVTVTGCTITIDGIASNGIKIPPGEQSIIFGGEFAVMDTITISCPDIGWVILLQDRD